MPPLYWLDVAALSVSVVLATALVLVVLGGGPRRALNRSFALFAALEATWAVCSLLQRLDLWWKIGNPLLLTELNVYAVALMGPTLLLFTASYTGRRTRWIDRAVLLGLLALALLSIPLFRHQLVFNPRVDSNGSTTIDLSTWGFVAAILPTLYFAWSLILFWRGRQRVKEPSLISSAAILLAGFFVGGVLEVRFPLLPLTNTLSMAVLGFAVVVQQLFNPLRGLTTELERKVDERTRDLERAYGEVERRVEERTAELRAEIAERRRVEDTLRQRTAQLGALRQIGLELTVQLDLETLLHSIVSRAIELLGGKSGGLYLYRPERDVLEWVTAVGPDAQPLGCVLRRGEGLSGRVWVTGTPLVVDDYKNWEERSHIFDDYPWEAIIGVPVSWGEEFLGVLNVEAPAPQTFSPADAELLTLFATQAAIAIRNARLYQVDRSRAERLAVVNRIASAAGTTLDLDTLLEMVYQETAPIFQADAFFIALYNANAHELEFRLQVDEGVRLPMDRLPANTGLTALVVNEGKPLYIADLEQEQSGLPQPQVVGNGRNPRSWLGVPMQIGEWLVGVISVQAYRPGAYSEEDRLLLSTIADQVAVAVERARLYETLHESEEKYRALFEQANDAVFLETLDGSILEINDRACQLLGYERWELVQLTVADLVPPGSHTGLLQVRQRMRSDRELRLEAEMLRRDGSTIPVEASVAMLKIAGRDLVLALVRDITERKRAEEQLRQAQKMEAIGTLAGGVAHDFNNILTGILGYASLVRQDLPADSLLRRDMDAIVDSARRARDLTQQLLTFARRSPQGEMRPLDLNAVVHEVVKLLERTIDRAISIELHLSDGLNAVNGDAGQLHQVVLNLCLNARDAMPRGGQLIIETGNTSLSEWEAHSLVDIKPGEYVVLSVTDTGTGIAPAIRERIFEPFFTTKEQGRGLGLAIIYGIVRGHGGTIHVYSEPEQGTTFRVYLPTHAGPAQVSPPPATRMPTGSETVLVVDDEESVRDVLQRILQRGGYTVLLAGDGIQAIECYRQHGAEIGLVVLDMIMPHMGGQAAYEQLREIDPQVKVLFSSGYSENGPAGEVLASGARGFLQKPYDLQTVLRTVRQVLDT